MESSKQQALKLELADIANGNKSLLEGFKVLGVFPFYFKYVENRTHIDMCVIKEHIQELAEADTAKLQDFYDSKLQRKLMPLVLEYCVVALVNRRPGAFFFKYLLRRRARRMSHAHILNMYATVLKMDEPSFFLVYYRGLLKKDNTLLKEA